MKNKKELPKWVDPALQGLAYWAGYKREYYPFYELTEGAYVGELCQAIQAHKSDSEILEPERMYKELFPMIQPIDSENEGSNDSTNIRVDVAIGKYIKRETYRKNKSKSTVANRNAKLKAEDITAIIELKKYKKNNFKDILQDLVRLSQAKKINSDVRCFEIIICVGIRPDKLIDENDYSIGKVKEFENEGFSAYVRKVRKVYEALKGRNYKDAKKASLDTSAYCEKYDCSCPKIERSPSAAPKGIYAILIEVEKE